MCLLSLISVSSFLFSFKPRILLSSKQRLSIKQIRGRNTGAIEDDDVMYTLTSLLEMIFDVGSKRYDEKKLLKHLDLSAEEAEKNALNPNDNISNDERNNEQNDKTNQAYTEHDDWM